MNLKNYYQILNVRSDASRDDIRRAFRQLALRYHPDHNPGNSEEAEERFKEINEAYELLSDDQKRRQYDLLISQPGGVRRTVVVEDIFNDDIDLGVIRQMMQEFADLDPSFWRFGRRRSWGCKRQRGRRCRGR